MISPGLWEGNSITMAPTPVPNIISTSVPRNSATNSANNEGFEAIASPEPGCGFRPRSSLSSGQKLGNVCLEFPWRAEISQSHLVGAFSLDISGHFPKIEKYLFISVNIYSL